MKISFCHVSLFTSSQPIIWFFKKTLPENSQGQTDIKLFCPRLVLESIVNLLLMHRALLPPPQEVQSSKISVYLVCRELG